MFIRIEKPSLHQVEQESKNWRFHSEEKECRVCKVKFDYGFKKTQLCGLCKVFLKCGYCNEEFEFKLENSGPAYYETRDILEKIINGEELKLYCLKCSKDPNPGICSICKTEVLKRDVCNRGYSCNCHQEWYNKHNSTESMRKVQAETGRKNIQKFFKSIANGGNCSICGIFNEELDHNGRGKNRCNCSKEAYKKMAIISAQKAKAPGVCTQCGKDTNEYEGKKNRTIFGVCMICQAEIAKKVGVGNSNFITRNKVRYYKNIEINQFSSKILSGELDINDYPGINIRCGRVCYGTEDIVTSDKILMNNNFIELDGIKFYKNIEINEFVRQLDSGETEIPSGFNKRFGRWHYNALDVLTGDITKLNNSNFEEKDNILYYYDRSVKDYIPWEEYKAKFSTYNIDFKLPEGFKLYPTFRTQDSEDWTGAREAFEQSLVESDISWFVYIKFDELNRPLVAGKSGSRLVNENTDVSFSTDINDGPARRYLQENSLNWCKTQIAICSCNSEEEAYILEENILENYNLFGG